MSRELKTFLVGVFEEEDQIIAATRAVVGAGLPVHDCFTPYAVHGAGFRAGARNAGRAETQVHADRRRTPDEAADRGQSNPEAS